MQNTDRLCMGCMSDNGGNAICPICGFDENSAQNASYMPVRTLLDGRYVIGKVLDSSSDGVTYIAWDKEEDMAVRVREYMPERFCERAADRHTLRVIPGNDFLYNDKLLEFLDIARALSRLSDNAASFIVTDIFESNNTGYYVTENVSSITLREFLLRNGGMLSWEQARPLLMPLLSTLSELHEAGLYHMGISPETIMIGRDGRARLVGFSVSDARIANTELGGQLFPGFAAAEQYEAGGKTGEWTDVYGFAATLYRVLAGNPPPEATERIENDRMIIPAKVAQLLPRSVMSAMANALSVFPEDRTQSVEDLKEELNAVVRSGSSGSRAHAVSRNGTNGSGQKGNMGPEGRNKNKNRKYAIIAAVTTGVVLIIAIVLVFNTVLKDKLETDSQAVSNAPAPQSTVVSLEPDVVSTEKLYEVPDFSGMTYAEIMKNPEYSQYFTFEISDGKFTSEYEQGDVYDQSPKAGSTIKAGQKITLKISLGSGKVQLPNYAGMDKNDVYVDLLERGFKKENIRFDEKWDDTIAPGKVVSTDPVKSTSVSIYSTIVVYINSYKEPVTSTASVASSSSSSATTSSAVPTTSSVLASLSSKLSRAIRID